MPSAIYHIEEPLTAFAFDRAVAVFGSGVEAELEAAGRGAKSEKAAEMSRNMVLVKWIPELQAGKFREPKPTR